MNEKTFYYIATKSGDCRIDFYIADNLMFVNSNYPMVKNLISCYYDEKWLEIIKDRGYWDYFFRKLTNEQIKYTGDFCSQNLKKCIEQMIKKVKDVKNDR